MEKLPRSRFGTVNLRTQEIVNQIADSRIDFGIVRKNAIVTGIKSTPIGTLSYVAVVPAALIVAKKPPTLGRLFTDYPLAMQTTEGEFTKRLREIAAAEDATLRPGLACQSFPQVFAAVRSERFAAVLPEIATRELPAHQFRILRAEPLSQLQRDIALIWNPRVVKVRPAAAKVLVQMQSVLRFT